MGTTRMTCPGCEFRVRQWTLKYSALGTIATCPECGAQRIRYTRNPAVWETVIPLEETRVTKQTRTSS